jgi:iron(III) transport system permease protein
MRFASSRGDRNASESQPIRLHGKWALLALILCALPVLLGFVAPVLIMLIAYAAADPTSVPLGRFISWTSNSLALGLSTAFLAVAMALALAANARLRPGRLAVWAVRLTSLGYAVPGVVIVVGLLLPLGWLQAVAPHWGMGFWLTGTFLGLIWAYLTRFVAVALQSVQSGYARMTPQMDDSARMLGASGWRLLARVHIPQLKKPLAAAGLLVMVDVMKELPATLVLRPFNSDTLAVMAYQLARDERLGEAALPSLALVVVGLLPVVLLSRTLRRN